MTIRNVASVLYCGFAPRRAARNNLGLSLRGAYALHGIGLAMTAAAVMLSLLMHGADEAIHDFFAECGRGNWAVMGATILTLAAVEVVGAVLGVMLLGVAAHDEPIRETYRHAQTTVWVHTGMVAPAFLLCSLAILWFESPPFLDVSDWTVMLLALLVFGSIAVWLLGALFRAASLPRALDPIDRPQLCEYCGYNLSFIEEHERCPECGVELILSLRNPRGPTPWAANGRGRVRTWGLCARQAWFQPEVFFRRMVTDTGMGAALSYFAMTLFVAASAAWAATVACLWAFVAPIRSDPDLYVVAGWVALGITTLQMVFVCLLGSIVGIVVSRQERRNRAGVAMQVAFYCSSLLPLWGAGFISLVVALWAWMAWLNLYTPAMVLIWNVSFLGLHVLFGLVYIVAVARRMKFVRWANR